MMSVLIAFAIVVGQATAQAPDPAIDLRSLMSEDEFRAMGLENLTDEQLQQLGRWFRDHRGQAVESARAQAAAEAEAAAAARVAAAEAEAAAATAAAETAAAESAARAEKPEKASEAFTARVLGFVGWNGKTVFKLSNGQVWQQRMPGRFRYYEDANEVVFDKNVIGGWKMEHVESGRTVLVEQIR